MQISSRRVARQLLGQLTFSEWKSVGLVLVGVLLAYLAAYVPEHQGLSPAGCATLFILSLCAWLWITEAMPAFAVSLLAIGLEILILGRPGGVFAESPDDWQRFVVTWGSPLIWLFFGGFVLAQAAEETQLDRWMAANALSRFGQKPAWILLGTMGSTALLSMFMSNTATATLFLAVLAPVYGQRKPEDGLSKAMLLGIAFAANIGGMGTVIGSPPNAIAVGVLERTAPIDFAQWMVFAIPPVLVLLTLAWGFLVLRYFGRRGFEPLTVALVIPAANQSVPLKRQALVMLTFAATVTLWISSPWHGIPTTVVSFVPICVLTATGILGPDDIRKLPWEVLLLIAGGLSLGVAIADTGLAAWLVEQLPLEQFSPLAVAIAFCFLMILLSNLMSNTAAANMVLPLVLAASANANPRMVVPIALSASAAMCLPISTPPNALVFGTRRLKTVDLLAGGLLIGLVSPPVVVGWAWCIERFGW